MFSSQIPSVGGGAESEVQDKMQRKKYRKKINCILTGRLLRAAVNRGNRGNLRPDGPYGIVALALKQKNTKRNRRHLQTIWVKKHGGVRSNEVSGSSTSVAMLDATDGYVL